VTVDFDFVADTIDLSIARVTGDFGQFLRSHNLFMFEESHLERPADVRFHLPALHVTTALKGTGQWRVHAATTTSWRRDERGPMEAHVSGTLEVALFEHKEVGAEKLTEVASDARDGEIDRVGDEIEVHGHVSLPPSPHATCPYPADPTGATRRPSSAR